MGRWLARVPPAPAGDRPAACIQEPPVMASNGAVLVHGSDRLPEVQVDSYNVALKDGDGKFLGDRACKEAFASSLERWREPLRGMGVDPFGDQDTNGIGKKDLEAILREGEPEAAGVVQGAIEDFAREFATVTRRFLALKAWQDAERIV